MPKTGVTIRPTTDAEKIREFRKTTRAMWFFLAILVAVLLDAYFHPQYLEFDTTLLTALALFMAVVSLLLSLGIASASNDGELLEELRHIRRLLERQNGADS